VAATELGLRNIVAIADMLMDATTHEGEDYADLEELFGRLVGQRNQELRHVVTVVGGVHHYYRFAGTEGEVYVPVTKVKQQEAVAFLNQHAFHVPDFILDREILRRIESSGTIARVLAGQRQILAGLFNRGRVDRLIEQEALLGQDTYSLEELMADVRSGVWSELTARTVGINTYRRNLQRAHLDIFDANLNGEDAPHTDMKPLIRGELQELDRQLERALERAADRITRLHLEDMRVRIARILDPAD